VEFFFWCPRAWKLIALFCIAVPCAALAQTTYPPKPSIGESISSGLGKIGDAVTPKTPVTPADDPVSLQTKGKPSVQTYLAVARVYEEGGKFAEAEAQYKRAVQDAPNDLRALLAYARLKDRMGEPQEALKLYQRAARAHPKEPSVFNNLAVHYARQGLLRDAAGAMEQAVQLRPKEVKYRNNLAALLVELDRPRDAFTQLRAVHDEAAAHYNLGFLLNRKGQRQAAAQEFAIALRINPSLVQARQWLDRLSGGAMQGPPPGMQQPRPGMPLPPMAAQGPPPDARYGSPGVARNTTPPVPPGQQYPQYYGQPQARPPVRVAANPGAPYDSQLRQGGAAVQPDLRYGQPPQTGRYPEADALRRPAYGFRNAGEDRDADGNTLRQPEVRPLPPPPPRAPQPGDPYLDPRREN
jgi:Tfp pilus assembly protein PilF